jgi:hypothetical protein
MSATKLYPDKCDDRQSTASERLDGDRLLANGTLLNHFRIVKLIAQSGMGDVYEAHDESLERTVAIKVIRAAQDISPSDRARLIHEARAQARINHPHVVQIYYVGLEPDCPFLAMEFVPGTTMAERIRQSPLPFRDIVRIALQIIKALQRAFEMGIIHADIKPSNILLDGAGDAKLCDFGLAQRNYAEKLTAGLTGTPKYMAPELLDGKPGSVASDMYALGITLYELTLGRYPYGESATTLKQQFDLHRSAAIEFPQPWPPEIPEGWKEILVRLLAKQPELRYADYRQLYFEIKRMEPKVRLPAAILPRVQAWGIDLILMTMVLTVVALLWHLLVVLELARPDSAWGHVIHFSVNLAQVLIFGLFIWAHGKWKTTPGKWLFQISLTDQHGLPVSSMRLMLRLLMSQFPVSLGIVPAFFEQFTSGEAVWWIWAELTLNGLWLIGNVVAIVIDKRRLALHDRLLGTRVVVDHAG